jgi:hypothetical protein
MPDDPRTALLERRYRRWLFAYPRRYRRERGPEILATLLESAEPNRDRPAARETARLLWHGLGTRLDGAGARAYVVASFAAVLGALSGIALGSWLSWSGVADLAPDKTTTARLARTALPVPLDGAPTSSGVHTFWNPNSDNSLHGGTGLRVGRTVVGGKVARHANVDQLAAAIAQRMRAHGWQRVRTTIDTYTHASPPAIDYVTGTRDGYLMTVELDAPDEANRAAVYVGLMWDEPSSQPACTVAGGVAGAALGVLLALYTSVRMRRRGRGAQRAYGWLWVLTLLLLAPACVANIPTSTGSAFASTYRDGPGPNVYWGGFVFFGAEPLAILSLVPFLALLVVCLLPRRAATGRRITTA